MTIAKMHWYTEVQDTDFSQWLVFHAFHDSYSTILVTRKFWFFSLLKIDRHPKVGKHKVGKNSLSRKSKLTSSYHKAGNNKNTDTDHRGSSFGDHILNSLFLIMSCCSAESLTPFCIVISCRLTYEIFHEL